MELINLTSANSMITEIASAIQDNLVGIMLVVGFVVALSITLALFDMWVADKALTERLERSRKGKMF